MHVHRLQNTLHRDVDGESMYVVSIYDIMMSCQISESRIHEDQSATLRLVPDMEKSVRNLKKVQLLLEKGVVRKTLTKQG